jgi:DNA-binding GntR family transcriptional regulator
VTFGWTLMATLRRNMATRMTMTEVKRKRGRPRKIRATRDDNLPRIGAASLHELVSRELRTMIVQGVLAPDTVVIEADLCERLGVSRTPLREALKLLALEGLVELRQNRSARITPLLVDEAVDLFEALSSVERCAAEFAATRMTADQIEELARMQAEMELHYANGRLAEYFVVNHAIHSFIVAGSGNKALIGTHEWLLARAERARFAALRSHSRWTESVEEHRGILEAITARDAAKAGALLGTHVMHTADQIKRHFAGGAEAAA